MSMDDYEGWIETLEIMSDPEAVKDIKQAEKDIKEGRVYDFEEVFGEEIKKIKKRPKK